jgi:hypothetical protein
MVASIDALCVQAEVGVIMCGFQNILFRSLEHGHNEYSFFAPLVHEGTRPQFYNHELVRYTSGRRPARDGSCLRTMVK